MPPTHPEAIEKLKHAPDVAGVDDLIRRRWSPRAYADKEVPPAELKRLFEAARWAASSSNEQPWRFLVGRRGDETYQKIFNALVEFNQSWAKSAPVLVLSVAKKTFTQKGTPNRVWPARHRRGHRRIWLCRQPPTDCTPIRWRALIANRCGRRLRFPLIMKSARSRQSDISATRPACPSTCTRWKYLRASGKPLGGIRVLRLGEAGAILKCHEKDPALRQPGAAANRSKTQRYRSRS